MHISLNPRDHGLPFDAWRPGQRLATRYALASKTYHTILQMPTGAGKSTVAGMISQLDTQRVVTLTATKGLQDQYTHVMPHFYDVRGMSNYECLAAKTEFKSRFQSRRRMVMCDDGPCRDGALCSLKESGCLYFDRYRGALASRTPLTGYAYWFAMRRYGRGLGMANRLLLDEAHALPEELMGAGRLEVPVGIIEGNYPNTAAAWQTWAAGRLQELKHTPDGTEDLRSRKRRLTDTLERLTRIDDTWAWDSYGGAIIFEPTIPRLLLDNLTDTATCKSLVYLSATITPKTLDLLGIEPKDVTFHTFKSTFPVKRRPIYVVKSVRLDYRTDEDGLAWWASRIDRIMRPRLDRKCLIHAISYARAQEIVRRCKYSDRFWVPRNAGELAMMVEDFRRADPRSGATLLSPSIMTGWDFPYTDAEYQIVAKVPFPDTRSSIAKARMKATPGYRDHLTVQSLQQACGRINRASDDQGETFIIDDHARWFLKKAGKAGDGLLAEWFEEALIYVDAVPDAPPPLERAA